MASSRRYLFLLIALGFGLRLLNLDTLPRSLSLDEAVDGLDALQLTRLVWLTPFLQNNFGRETLFLYIQGLALHLYGLSFFSLRFASAVVGTLTIPLLYVVGQRLDLESHNPSVAVRGRRVPVVAILAATGLAVSYWHIYFSRVALRAILLPPLLLIVIWCFWRGWYASPRPGEWVRRGWLIAAGFWLGVTSYTYLAARLLPLLFTVFVATELLRDRSALKKRLIDFLIFGSVAVITATPLLLYFWQNPQAFASRTQAISIFAGDALLDTFWTNLVALLKIHLWGETWLGEWPALNLLSALGFGIGLPLCVYHCKQPVMRFLLLWWAVGITPVLFSHQDWTATTTLLRGIIAWPALFLISAVGLTAVSRRIANSFWPGTLSPDLRLMLPVGLLVFGGLTAGYQYFFTWATTDDNPSDHPAYLARYLNSQTGQLMLTPLKFYNENVTNFLLQAHYPYLTNLKADNLPLSTEKLVYLLPDESTAESSFVLLAPAANGQGTAYLLPPLTLGQVEALSAQTRHTTPLSTVLDSEGEPIAQVYPMTAESPFLSFSANGVNRQPIQTSFSSDVLLTGYRVEPAVIKPGETVMLTLNWQALRPIDGDYYLFIHLFEIAQGRQWGQVNTPLTGVLFNAHRWPVGLTVPDPYGFQLPADAPDGPYRFEVGLYQAASQERLPITVNGHRIKENRLILGKLQVQRRPPQPPQQALTKVQFGGSIALIGFDRSSALLRPGQTLTYTLYWQALKPISRDYTVFTHLLDAAGNLRAQRDQPPQYGRYPTSWWSPGETVSDSYSLALPPDLGPGSYTLRVGLYRPETGQRLPLKDRPQDFVDLPNFIKLEN